MALAIASGVPPQHGLYTAMVAGAVCAFAGGSRFNMSGPTAAFVAILAPVAARHGVGGLATATLMAGGILLVMGFARMGRLIQSIPHPVTTGFTAGIAVVIATLQVKDFLGLTVPGNPEHSWERALLLARALPSTRWGDAAVGGLTLALLLFCPRVTRRVPAPLIAIPIACLLLTVAFDRVIAVVVGVALAALLFMRRMVDLASARFVEPARSPHGNELPPGVILYEVAGPFFFGAAQKLVSALGRVAAECRAVVLNLSGVPVMDMTGLVALQSLVQGLASRKTMVILTALQDQPWELLRKAGLHESGGHLQIDCTLEDSLAYVRVRFR